MDKAEEFLWETRDRLWMKSKKITEQKSYPLFGRKHPKLINKDIQNNLNIFVFVIEELFT